LRIADFGLRILRASVVRHDLRSSQSAIRNPQFSGSVGIVSVTLCAGASLGCAGEKRPAYRSLAVDR